MCEETNNYLWALQDKLGHGATSQVFKAYNKATGELVAAKVYQSSSNSRRTVDSPVDIQPQSDYRPLLDREMDILKAADHKNIVRYIALEPVTSSDAMQNTVNREALMIEYCNGGSLLNVLDLPENRYGLMEDEFILVFRHLTNALRYLHDKHTIHRDIKPDNIMLSIDINGEHTYKLADLGVARLINEGENTFTTLVGTEEYIHPDLYRAAVHDNKTNGLRAVLQKRVDFPFEVDLWSLGVTLYQCATGELPFQPFAGTRKDRAIMRHILDNKPAGMISGIEMTPGGIIQWSKKLPDSCRLSLDLKSRLEILLPRLLESDRNKLMSFPDFFSQADYILGLIPIYYLDLKRFVLSCSYFEPSEMINQLYEKLRKENNDSTDEEYQCLFQNISYPIEQQTSMTVKNFCDKLPNPTSRQTPLVFYTFSSLKTNENSSPKLIIPHMKPIKRYNDVAAACDWSKDVVGFFFFIKSQLVDYQRILQTAQCSTTIIEQHLRSKLVEFLSLIRSKLIVFRAIEELKYILDQMDSQLPGEITNQTRKNSTTTTTSSIEQSFSPMTSHRTSSSMQLIQQSIRIYLRSYLQPYEKLKTCEQNIAKMIENDFTNDIHHEQAFSKSLWSPERTKTYSLWIHRTDKFLKDLIDLNDSFRKDRLLSTYNRLQSDSHFRRRKNLEALHENYINFAQEDCYPNLIQGLHDYNQWISQRGQLLERFRTIEQIFKKQCEEIIDYVDMIDDLRQIVYKSIRGFNSSNNVSNCEVTNSKNSEIMEPLSNECQNLTIDQGSVSSQSIASSDEEITEDSSTNKNFIKKIRGKTRKRLHLAEESFLKLDNILRQFRSSMQKK